MGKIAALVAVVLVYAPTNASYAAVTVDGDLADWGVTLNHSKKLVFGGGIVNGPTNPGHHGKIDNHLGSGKTLHYHAEDSSDSAPDSAFLGPYYGGQNYDGEFMGVMVDGSKLHVGISTGQRPDNGFSKFSPGDLRIETSIGTFGIEMGGGAGSTLIKSGMIGVGDAGASYLLDGQGVTVDSTTHGGDATAGSVWFSNAAGDWIMDAIASDVAVQLNHSALDISKLVGIVDSLVYNFDASLGQHAFIELTLDLDLLLGGLDEITLLSIFWAPSCDNDELSVSLSHTHVYSNPEPASIAIWLGIGAAAAVYVRRKRLRT